MGSTRDMNLAERQSVEELFEQLIDAPDAVAAEALLNCDSSKVVQEVRRLLHAARKASTQGVTLRDSLKKLTRSFDDTRLEPGTKVGAFEIIDLLGEGGMGTVYRARQEMTQRVVALKLVRAGYLSGELVRRFRFEVEVLGKLNHSSVARVLAAGIDESSQGRRPYFAMELVEGRPLDVFVLSERPDRVARLTILRNICEAVGHAH